MKFATIALCVSLTASLTDALRGSGGNSNSHRHLLKAGTECVPYYKVMHYKDFSVEGSWDCALDEDTAAAVGTRFVKIEGISGEEMVQRGAGSGASILRVGANSYVEGGSKAVSTASFSTVDSVVLRVSKEEGFEIEEMNEDDTRHHRHRKARRDRDRRSLAESVGTLNTLVVRVLDKNGASPPSATDLNREIFEDDVSLKKQYDNCSHGNINIKKSSEGIIDVKVNQVANGNSDSIVNAAYGATESRFGGYTNLGNKFDLVMYCLPPGTGDDWIAFAYVNGMESVYNDQWCNSVSGQMHEVGHNIGLEHSGIQGYDEYSDSTGAMGYSYSNHDFPKFCFNAAKQYQLGWYPAMSGDLNPQNIPDGSKKYILNSVVDYNENNTDPDKLVTLRLKYKGNAGKSEWYIGYNRAVGFNEDTLNEANRVHIIEKENPYGEYYGYNYGGQSWRVASLGQGDNYSLKVGSETVKIRVNKIDGKNAVVTIINGTSEQESCPRKEVPTREFTITNATNPTNSVTKTCRQVGRISKRADRRKMCRKTADSGKKVHQICPESCGEVGIGKCKFLDN